MGRDHVYYTVALSAALLALLVSIFEALRCRLWCAAPSPQKKRRR